MCLLAKRLEHGHFVWPNAESGVVHLTPAQLSMLLEEKVKNLNRSECSANGVGCLIPRTQLRQCADGWFEQRRPYPIKKQWKSLGRGRFQEFHPIPNTHCLHPFKA